MTGDDAPSAARVEATVDSHTLDALIALDVEVFGSDAWSAAVWAKTVAAEHRELAVLPAAQSAEDPTGESGSGARVDGFAVLAVLGDVADLERIAVRPGRRRRGLGTRLLDHTTARAARAGASAVVLEVRSDNDTARAFYDDGGFREVGRRRGYYADGTVDAILMEKQC